MKKYEVYALVGQTFHYLTLLEVVGKYQRPNGNRYTCGRFLCKCGTEYFTSISQAFSGHTRSCGCYRKERYREVIVKHNASYTKVFGCWAGMKGRCYNKNEAQYKNYGGRGITVCEEWINNSKAFIDWALANGYVEGLELDRIDVNKGYSPDNCRFVDQLTNARNKTNTLYYTLHGQTKTLGEWSEQYGKTYVQVYKRIKIKGWSLEKALTTPMRKMTKKLPFPGDQQDLFLTKAA